MTTLVKLQAKGQMTIPTKVRSAVGLSDGDLVEVRTVGKKIILTPQLVIDRSQFPNADDEYTPAQRRVINARLAKADEDVKAGRVHGPFETHAELVKFLHAEKRKAKAKTKSRAR